ncbi:MAG: flippase-like domain-containing protein [Bacteroidia bacterium]|nr:flippase-like domain-containing protein [Bacteroidia bacterium]
MTNKKRISLLFKLIIGIASFSIIYWRLKNDFTSEQITLLKENLLANNAYLYIGISVLLFPLNWAMESYKWKLITAQTEKISFSRAQKSVYAGICVGNLAPGRATEFLAKIHFFKPENRIAITVLHFINGMFQLSITIVVGILSLVFSSNLNAEKSATLNTVAICLSLAVGLLFIISILKINKLIGWVYKKTTKGKEQNVAQIKWSASLLSALFLISMARYIVFATQFYLLIAVFNPTANFMQLFSSIGAYFLLTTIIPMFSLIEAAVRAAIALVVFSGIGISNPALALIAVLLWLINIVMPSIVGYFVLLKENLSLASFKLKNRKE